MEILTHCQILALAMNEIGGEEKEVTFSQLYNFNEGLKKKIPGYKRDIDRDTLYFDIGSIATEFTIETNQDYEKVIKLIDGKEFDYFLYESTIPEKALKFLKTSTQIDKQLSEITWEEVYII